MIITRNSINSQRAMSFSIHIAKALAFSLAITCAASAQTTIFVDDNNCPTPGTGSQVDAYCSIQVAIVASADGDTIEVSPGTYHEAIDFIGKAITLRSTNGPATTIINATGVLDAGDGVTVVRCVNGETEATVLDGFTISGGTGDTTISGTPIGGGMFNNSSSPTVTNCVFNGNHADFGGGMYNRNSSPSVTECTFSDNTSINGHGAGMRNFHISNPTLTNCTFSRNHTTNGVGGGIANYASSPTLHKCIFNNNSADFGGGVYNNISRPIVSDCIFIDNTSTNGHGGGIRNIENFGITITNCTFIGNTSMNGDGGGIANSSSSPTIAGCTFIDNTAESGGGMSNTNSMSMVTNCSFSGNSANLGAAMLNYDSNTAINNSTFNANEATTTGGGLFNTLSRPILTNCILWGDSPNEISSNFDLPIIANCDISGSGGSAAWDTLLGIDGGKNIDKNPLFVDPIGLDGIAGTTDDNLRIMLISPALNKGDTSAIPSGVTTDLDGLPRVVCDVDMGAYENQSPPTRIHNITQDSFYCTIQDCIDTATNNQECVVLPGIYSEAIDFLGKPITLRSLAGPMLTIIDATDIPSEGETVSVVRCVSGESSTTVLDGFTITGGTGDTNIFLDPVGGGMFNNSSNPTVSNCIFTGNKAELGGGIFNNASNPTMTQCKISKNSAIFGGGMHNFNLSKPQVMNSTFSRNISSKNGGGMYNVFSIPTMTNCTFSRNVADEFGGGIHNFNSSSPLLNNCSFTENSAQRGGGICNFDASSPTITNCTFIRNIATRGGGMYNFDASSPTVTNCSFSGNFAQNGGGIFNLFSSNPTLTNSILWDDNPDEILNATFNSVVSTPAIAYSNVQYSGGSDSWDGLVGVNGGGNIDVEPRFVDPLNLNGLINITNGNLRLMHGSPCIDAADYDAYLSVDGGLTDLDGKDRIIDNMSVMDTGVGAITYLDMGAYENGLCPTDGIIDLNDLERLDSCLTGPNDDLNLGCTCIDLNKDEHINLRDFAHLQLVFNP